jgi:hypothetical protein
MTFGIVAGVLLVAVLAGAAWMDRRARSRGARVRGDIGVAIARTEGSEAAGDARSHSAERQAGNSWGL